MARSQVPMEVPMEMRTWLGLVPEPCPNQGARLAGLRRARRNAVVASATAAQH